MKERITDGLVYNFLEFKYIANKIKFIITLNSIYKVIKKHCAQGKH